ncbi:MAG: hypothetical protein K2K46_12265 [Lachnospiraceae bacterium]|nr:hypothetical protein [Lachnospiraceae bacterium]
MNNIKNLYNRFQGHMENGIFIIILAFYPLIKINQGLDVADTAYSLTNFQYFPTADGTWMVATYLANVLGYLFMQFPKGDTLIGMYFYTGMILSATALIFYFELRKKIPAAIVFVGEIIALGLCWCPTTILYNYLTYLLMDVGILLLYKGICTDKQKYVRYLLLAGICLGANVTVRMPNVVQAAFILALWYAEWLKKEKVNKCIKDTFICIAGYLIGFGVPFVAICVKYGIDAYPKMVQSMFAMTDKAVDYKPVSMLTGMFGDYLKGLYWLIFAGICLVFLYAVYFLGKKAAPGKGETLFGLLCIATCCILIRFYWGKGMFTFDYLCHDYRSIYHWAVFFLIVALGCAVYLLVSKKYNAEDKALALLIIIQIFVTPLGSNNWLFPIINNLFIAAPFTLWLCGGWLVKSGSRSCHFPWKTMLVSLIVMVLIQSIGFHFKFAFNDGVWGEKRDTLATEIPKCRGIYTTRDNAELLTELVKYAEENDFSGQEVILYGELPGLSYLFDMPTAISTSWPDLDSYALGQFVQDMEAVKNNMAESRPKVIVAAPISAYKSEDAQAYKWFGVDEEAYRADEKLSVLLQFLDDYGYKETFCNMKYAIYE